MSSDEVEVKTVPAVRVAELSAPVGGFEPQFITPVLGPLFDQLMRRLGGGGGGLRGARRWPTTRTRGTARA